MATRDSQLTVDVCLALVAEGRTHGWALVRDLAPDGEIGRIWSVSRPLVYRALELLVDAGLVTRAASVPGQGPERAVVAITRSGQRRVRAWLAEPVTHLREVRTVLLVKLALRTRRTISNEPLLVAQRDALAPTIATLVGRHAGVDPVSLWRRENARAVQRFLDRAIRVEQSAASSAARGSRVR